MYAWNVTYVKDMPTPDQLLANAAFYLMESDEKDAALVLRFCDVVFGEFVTLRSDDYRTDYGTEVVTEFSIVLLGPALAYRAIKAIGNGYIPEADKVFTYQPMEQVINDAFEAVVPAGVKFKGIEVKVKLVEVPADWREELQNIAAGRSVTNQGLEIRGKPLTVWKYLRFRSNTEALVAQELDATGVLFLPNCLARLNQGEVRVTREADFLVCHKGKWGILEVDGPTHERAANDHDRDRLFQEHGIRVTQRFTAEECYKDPAGVVRRFLLLLDKNG